MSGGKSLNVNKEIVSHRVIIQKHTILFLLASLGLASSDLQRQTERIGQRMDDWSTTGRVNVGVLASVSNWGRNGKTPTNNLAALAAMQITEANSLLAKSCLTMNLVLISLRLTSQ